MKKRAFLGVWGVFALALACVLPAMAALAPAAAAGLTGVRFGLHADSSTRIVFDLTGPVEYSLSGDAQGQGHLIVDIKGLDASSLKGAGKGAVASYAVLPGEGGVTKVVFSFSETAKLANNFIIPPKNGVANTRLVIDLAPADMNAFLASLPKRYEDLTPVLRAVSAPEAAAPEIKQAAADQAEAKSEAYRPLIVIDAGHGGGDPGATGPDGVKEKDVTLAAALQLKKILEDKDRYRILLTRAGDKRIELDDRPKAAREAGADLFISLHADAYHDAGVRGGSVYTLSDKGSGRSAKLAKTQGDYQIYQQSLTDIDERSPELGDILIDIAQRETKNESGRFASMLLQNLAGVVPLVNNSHRTDDLFVLLSPDVPAVLLEMAFISNKKDEANLNSPAWRKKAMTSVASAIDSYFDSPKEMRRAALSAAGGR